MKKRIAILGGGMGALATAFELTRRPGHQDRFEITVYQMGHRLGGKGASGVDLQNHARIEEHGLHVLWGFYENAFRMMRECYVELGRPPGAPLPTWEDAVLPSDQFVVPERTASGWDFWTFEAPRHDGSPGDGGPDLARDAAGGFDALSPILRAVRGLIAGEQRTARPSAIDRALRVALPRLRARLRSFFRGDARDDDAGATALETTLRDLLLDAASGFIQGTRALKEWTVELFDLDLAALVVETLWSSFEARIDPGVLTWESR